MEDRRGINRRILDEIEGLEATEALKEFLRRIVSFELDIIDKGNPRFTDEYKEMLENAISDHREET